MKINIGVKQLTVAFCIPASLGWVTRVHGQVTSRFATDSYINPGRVAGPARSFLFAFGDRIQRPGKERAIFTGKYTDRNGTADVAIAWEVPGRFRFDRSDKPGRPVIYDETSGWINAGALPSDEANALESLFDDTSESFFYATAHGAGRRFLGNCFRTDGGKTPNSSGPCYDVYQVFASVHSPSGLSRRPKLFLFDSRTRLLSRIEYQAAGSVHVSTELSGWHMLGGQAFPGSVVRKENGVVVLTVNFTSASAGPSASDGLFLGR